MKTYIMLSICTGMRISDVATFDISQRLNGNDVFLRMHKTKKELFTSIPGWLVKRLRVREQKMRNNDILNRSFGRRAHNGGAEANKANPSVPGRRRIRRATASTPLFDTLSRVFCLRKAYQLRMKPK
jgi:hypothetical protein